MKEIIFNHIETDEVVSPEFIAELHRMVARRLFEAWRKDYESSGTGTGSAGIIFEFSETLR